MPTFPSEDMTTNCHRAKADDTVVERRILYVVLVFTVLSSYWLLYRWSGARPGGSGRQHPDLLGLIESHDFVPIHGMRPDDLAEIVDTFESSQGKAYIVGAVPTTEGKVVRQYLLIEDGRGILIRECLLEPSRFAQRDVCSLKLAYCRSRSVRPLSPDVVAGDGNGPAEWNVLLFQDKQLGGSAPFEAFNQPGVEPFGDITGRMDGSHSGGTHDNSRYQAASQGNREE